MKKQTNKEKFFYIIGDKQYLNWLLVAAFRYSVNRHQTQAMDGIDNVIIDNLDVLETVFLEQFVDDILHEQELEKIHREWKLSSDDDLFFALKRHTKDALRLLQDVRDQEAQKLYLHLKQLLELLKEVDQDKIVHREYIFKPWASDTSYLMPLCNRLQKEIDERNGNL